MNDEEDELHAEEDFGKPHRLAGVISVLLGAWFVILMVILVRHMP
jgi:hypothetical protein